MDHVPTLRSMEEVFGDNTKTATFGLIVLICQLIFVAIVVIYVIHKAKQHLDIQISSDIHGYPISPEDTLDTLENIVVIPKLEKTEVQR